MLILIAGGVVGILGSGQIYRKKDTPGGQKAWEDFVKYSNDAGLRWLMDQDLYQGFTAGTKEPR